MENIFVHIRRRLEWMKELGLNVWLETTETASSDSSSKEVELKRLADEISVCRKCRLGSLRKNAVFGTGNPNADLVFIGEAPGATEDETGLPFVGAAGNLLTQELGKHGISRDEVFICNILKCRPPNNRDPLPDEIASCEPYLLRQLDLLNPRLLCGLGRFAVMTLLKRPISIMKIRGTWQSYHGIPLFVCLHPAAVLHQPQNRQLFSADIAALARAYRERHDRLPEVKEANLI
ncbi:MAG: uracil-DNA glycosylase [Candidatus Sumerlaeaceae bacterium]|nr:uracil-DNA glycosylase [Candidatus Sumerlaeaceae bacterium]